MLATLTSHHNLVHAGACVYDPEESRVGTGLQRFISYCLPGTLTHQYGGAPEGGDASGEEQ